MTQTFSLSTRYQTIHVSDRLLSRQTRLQAEEFDRNSNKAVVFLATDALVVATYTGLAFLDGRHTDSFIAQSLLGSPLSDTFAQSTSVSNWVDIGRSAMRLAGDLSAAFSRLRVEDRRPRFEVSLVGWKHRLSRNKRVTPISWTISRQTRESDTNFTISRFPRWWNWHDGFMWNSAPDPSPMTTEWLRGQLKERGSISPAEARNVLVEAIGRASAERPDTVGTSCVGITLSPCSKDVHVRVRFFHDVSEPDSVEHNELAYTPWIVAPPMAWGPSLASGLGERHPWTIHSTRFSWLVERADELQPKAKTMSMNTMKRRREPSR